MPDDATDEWFLQPDDFHVDHDLLVKFLKDVDDLLDRLDERELRNDTDFMVDFYDAAKATFDGDKTQIRTWFKWLYLIVFQKPDGPRWGEFVQIYGAKPFREKLYKRLIEIQSL